MICLVEQKSILKTEPKAKNVCYQELKACAPNCGRSCKIASFPLIHLMYLA